MLASLSARRLILQACFDYVEWEKDATVPSNDTLNERTARENIRITTDSLLMRT